MGRRGSTVAELLAAMALLAIAAGLAGARVTTLAASLRLATTTRTIAQTMRLVRGQAVAEGTALDVRFDAARATWSVQTTGGTVRQTLALPAPVAFTSLPARARIRFGTTGTAENGTVVLGVPGHTMSIVTNQRGRVRIA
jgi:Tfp pilus assembly protein FimT